MTGEELKDIRERFGMTQPDFAARLGVHRVSLSRFENNAEPITITVELAACELANRLKAERKLASKRKRK